MNYAACLLLINPESGSLRVTTRRNSDLLGLPGGKLDPTDETLLDCAIRETREETGIYVDSRETTFLYDALCPGEVDYQTACFFAYNSVINAMGEEPDIKTFLVDWDYFLDHCAFKAYNLAVRELYNYHILGIPYEQRPRTTY